MCSACIMLSTHVKTEVYFSQSAYFHIAPTMWTLKKNINTRKVKPSKSYCKICTLCTITMFCCCYCCYTQKTPFILLITKSMKIALHSLFPVFSDNSPLDHFPHFNGNVTLIPYTDLLVKEVDTWHPKCNRLADITLIKGLNYLIQVLPVVWCSVAVVILCSSCRGVVKVKLKTMEWPVWLLGYGWSFSYMLTRNCPLLVTRH